MSKEGGSGGGGETKRGRPSIKKTNLFSKDRASTTTTRNLTLVLTIKTVASMMYAFGDTDSTTESIAVMEDILTDFITELCLGASRAAGQRQKVRVDDFKFVLRNDPKKLGRVEELLNLQKEIQKAKKLFDEEES